MLIRFVIRNFLSFREEVEFSMIAGKPRKHPHHIISDGHRNSIDTLKVGIIYGANASGKSNLIKAMVFARQLIVDGTRPKKLIPITPFKLDKNCVDEPSKFEFEFQYQQKTYAYGFELDKQRIYTEWLYGTSKTAEKMIFERQTNNRDETIVEWGHVDFHNKKEKQFADFTARGTRPNQLFLTESIERGLPYFKGVFSWFDQVLTFILPDSFFNGLAAVVAKDIVFSSQFLRYLELMNSGISGVHLAPVEFREEFRTEQVNNLPINYMVGIKGNDNHFYLIFRNEENNFLTFKLTTQHTSLDGSEKIYFDFNEESDGTQRLMNLIPALIGLHNQERVYVIDELDRSLHPILSHKFIELFLNTQTQQKSQLIVTTHESSLLNLEVLRRDEIWFVEKKQDGTSLVYSLEEFAPRYDKDIRKGYLLGRFGAIPMIDRTANFS